MFYHVKQLQYKAKPDRPDPVYAKKLQEVLGGAFGEITVMMQYLFQGWNCRGPAKYRDMLLDIGTEEMAHVEMLATMIARLLEGSPVDQDAVAKENPVVAAVLGGMSPQHAIVWGLAPAPTTRRISRGRPVTSWPAATCWPIFAPTCTPNPKGGCRWRDCTR